MKVLFLALTLATIFFPRTTVAQVSPFTFGAANDAVVVEDADITADSEMLSSLTASFSPAAVNKMACIVGAGPSTATFCTTILTVISPTQVALASSATTQVSGARMVWGTDNTLPFRQAIIAASVGPQKTVYAPEGNYLFTTNGGLGSIPKAVRMQGSWTSAPGHLGYRYVAETKATTGDGTTFIICADEGTATGSFAFLNSNAAWRGIVTFYPAQLDSLVTPKLYPWTIEMHGMDPVVENSEFLNSYQAIYSHIGQRHLVRDVKGQPLFRGLVISQILDSSNYENIHWFPFYSWTTLPNGDFLTPLEKFVSRNAIAFQIGRADDARLKNCFAFHYWKWIKFVVDPHESTKFAKDSGGPGGMAWATITGGGGDMCSYPVDIDDVQGALDTGTGVTFIGSFMIAAQWHTDPHPAELYGVFARPTFTGRVHFNTCRFQLGSIHIAHQSSGGRMTITGSSFWRWTTAAIKTTTGGTLAITGNSFQFQAGSPLPLIQIDGSPWVSVSGNVIEYQKLPTISVSPTAKFASSGNVFSDGP